MRRLWAPFCSLASGANKGGRTELRFLDGVHSTDRIDYDSYHWNRVMPIRSARLKGRSYRLLQHCAVIGLCMLTAGAGVMAADVRVFTDRNHPVTVPAGVRIVALDAPARIDSELAANLPADPRQAAAIVQKRLNDGGAALQRRLADAYQGVTDAWGLGVTTIPAVVVDRRYVVYGERDVARALEYIDAYRRSQP
jgi:integrating conjugative element protein (TIGR03757 family)